ncbi:hypothetical protein D9756_003679 [Leucocoprinus leucothites]|uniref:Nephrocystin 3-like N-terminal domain-containing protein n=1 Tax=Leucocoprinus leucothites TaxID=201217 RepID=A0A8H5G109_9AGAR|nr:hypothetical protein D9756_003679 [Leucoagaricus leucothites]
MKGPTGCVSSYIHPHAMPGHSHKIFAKFFGHHDRAANSTRSEVSALQLTPLPLQAPVSSSLTSLPLPQPTQLLQPVISPPSTVPTPALRNLNLESPNPAPPTSSINPAPPASSLPLTSSPAVLPPIGGSPPPHVHAHDFVLNNPQFNHFSSGGSGIERLLKHSMPDAFHNSSARYPPPKCHLGTRQDYIALVTDWALGVSDRKEPILWMRGPFGVGKSAVAQSCAEALVPISKLTATLFFSRSNANRDDPRCVFTSIAYQVAATCPSFREIVDRRMIDDPALATKSLSTQFEDLLVHPFGRVDIVQSGLDGCVVIIDGLDECRGTAAQCEIIQIIAASARKRTTPFRWFITSRPEDAIIRTMNSVAVSSVHSRIELPVSRAIDHEILTYLTDEFKKIQESYGLPESWPSEEALALLVEHGAGLWIYVATMIRFIKDENSYGPKDQLQIVLEFMKDVSDKAWADNPLAEMDFFYTLIMQRIPLKLRITVRKILLLHSFRSLNLAGIAGSLDLSVEQLRRACASIQSVMELPGSHLGSMRINFYHASFLDFMKDPQRSKELCIYGDFLIEWRRELLVWLHEVCSRSTDSSHIMFPSDAILLEDRSRAYHYTRVLICFWELCQVPGHQLDSQTTMSVAELPFNKMLRLVPGNTRWPVVATRVRDNLPTNLRDKIIRTGKCPIPGCTNTEKIWILGHGENESVPKRQRWGKEGFELVNNEDSPNGKCICQVQY